MHRHLPSSSTGIGLKTKHIPQLLETLPPLGFLEIHAENYLVEGGPLHAQLERLCEHYLLSVHGVGLSIGGEGPLDEQHLAALANLLKRHPCASFSEHLAWSSHGDLYFNDLLPPAYTPQTLARVCAHIDQVQTALGRTILLENPSTYLEWRQSTYREPDFISEVMRRTGCGLLLDVNNIYVSCVNHNQDPHTYLAALPLTQVGQIHLAGFDAQRDAAGAPLLIDTHGAPVADAVWQLYAHALAAIKQSNANDQAPATLIEWDNHVPELSELLDQAARAQALMHHAL